MLICFSDIKFNNHCFIWEYNPVTNCATWNLELEDTAEHFNKKILLKKLLETEGIEITTDEQAIIKDAHSFFSLHEYYPLKTTSSYSSTSDSESLAKAPPIPSKRAATIPPLTFRSESKYPINFYSVLREGKYPIIHRKTVFNDAQILEQQRLSARQIMLFKTEHTIAKDLQLLTSEEFSPIKHQQSALLRKLVDGFLVPAFYKIKPKQAIDYKLFIAYLQRAICEVMSNNENNEPTEYEKLTLEECAQKFRSEAHYLEAIHEMRLVKARLTLRTLRCLVSSDSTYLTIASEFKDSELTIQDPELEIPFLEEGEESLELDPSKKPNERTRIAEILSLLKAELKTKKVTINAILGEIEKETAHAGSTFCKHKKIIAETNQALLKKNLGLNETIQSFYSCYFLIHAVLVTNKKIKAEQIPDIVTLIIAKLIGKILEDKKAILRGHKDKRELPCYDYLPPNPYCFNEDCHDLFFEEKHAKELTTVLQKKLKLIKDKELRSKKHDPLVGLVVATILGSLNAQATHLNGEVSRSMDGLALSPRAVFRKDPDGDVINRNVIFALKPPHKRPSQTSLHSEAEKAPPVEFQQ